jgi:hypothetical protein
MKSVIKKKLDELLKLKRLKTPSSGNEPEKDQLVVVSDKENPKEAGDETYKNKEKIKQDNLFKWDTFKKVWVTDSTNFKQAQDRLNFINKTDEFINSLEDIKDYVIKDGTITDSKSLTSKLTSYIDDLGKATDEKATDAAIRRYLTFQSKFHSYSFSNNILILIQRPDATKVAGREDWRKKLNRYVVADARGIWIFRPIFTDKNKKKKGSDLGDEGLDSAVRDNRLVGFKAVQVYDIADTKPFAGTEDIPSEPEWFSETSPTELTQKLYKYVSQVIEKENIKLTKSDARGGENGYSAGGHINMSSGVEGAGEVSTLVHELAHELMHWPSSKFYQGDEIKSDKKLKELQAESVSYVVMKHFNIPVQHHSTYIYLWKGNKEAITKNMETIRKVAKYIIDQIDELAEGDVIAEEYL